MTKWLLGLLLCLPLSAAELKLPESPVEPYTLIRMQVIDAEAIEDVMVMTVRGSEVSFVDIETSAIAGTYVFTGPPGVYSIRVKAKGAAPLVGRLEVRGTSPFPPTPVPPVPPGPTPPPVTKGFVWTIVIRLTDTMTADQSQVLSDLRQWSDQQPHDKLSHLEFSPNAEDSSGVVDARVAAWVAKIPATAKQPYVFISQPDASGKAAIVWQGELPAKAEDIIARIKELM